MGNSEVQSDPLVQAVAAFIDRRGLIPPGAGVVVGVSGGADSIGLLSVLHSLSAESKRCYKLTVAHVNHGLRSEAQQDAAFVAALADQLRLPCIVERRDVAGEAGRRGIGIEEAGRSARYEFFAAAAAKTGSAVVAVGHQADDNVETILHRIIRGTHLRGLAGIPPSRPLVKGGPMLVRPLLECSRNRIEEYCVRQGLSWRVDESNSELVMARNFLRHELLPLLRRRLNPEVDGALARLSGAAGDAEAYLCRQAKAALIDALKKKAAGDGVVTLDCRRLVAEEGLVRTYAARMALEEAGVPMGAITAGHLTQLAALLEGQEHASISLPGGYGATACGGKVTIGPAGEDTAVAWPAAGVACPGVTVLGDGRRLATRVDVYNAAAVEVHCRSRHRGVEMLDADSIDGDLACRPRRDGDAFMPLGSPGRQKVGDFLTNLKLSGPQRQETFCICDRRGIVYLCPLRIDQRVRLTTSTRRILRMELLVE
jgi:tRNA(Ile)-lysidine synthase